MGYPRRMDIETLLEKEEGYRPYVYKDSEGYWTIGIGLLVDERKGGGGITHDEAVYLMRNRIKEKTASLVKALPWLVDLDKARQTVIIAMAFQMGVEGVLKFKNTLAALKMGDYRKAAAGIRGSLWAQQTPGRAERMAKAIETGELV